MTSDQLLRREPSLAEYMLDVPHAIWAITKLMIFGTAIIAAFYALFLIALFVVAVGIASLDKIREWTARLMQKRTVRS